MNELLSYTYEFIDTRFDLTSELTDDSNQCYGEDVAKHLYQLFKNDYKNTEIVEEDWGWSVIFDAENDNEKGTIALCIYPWGFLDDLKGEKEYLWRIRIVFHKGQKLLGLIKLNKQALLPTSLANNISNKITPSITKLIGMHKGLVWQ